MSCNVAMGYFYVGSVNQGLTCQYGSMVLSFQQQLAKCTGCLPAPSANADSGDSDSLVNGA